MDGLCNLNIIIRRHHRVSMLFGSGVKCRARGSANGPVPCFPEEIRKVWPERNHLPLDTGLRNVAITFSCGAVFWVVVAKKDHLFGNNDWIANNFI